MLGYCHRVRVFLALLASCCTFCLIMEYLRTLHSRKPLPWHRPPLVNSYPIRVRTENASEHLGLDPLMWLDPDDYYSAYEADIDTDRKSTLASASDPGAREYGTVLTLFTTLKDVASRDDIHNRTFKNWAALSPGVRPVVYVPSSDVGRDRNTDVEVSGWQRRYTQHLRGGIPILKYMFMDILEHSETPFVGFANADILFDDSLENTLRHIYDVIDVNKGMVLIVGRRRNANITSKIGDGSDFRLVTEVASQLRLFRQDAQDYFIVSKRGLKWAEIPDFVVGRIGYDNWLVAIAQEWNITVIDTSYSIIAVHQLGTDGKFSGRDTNPEQVNTNIDMVPGFDFSAGITGCARLMTVCGDPSEDPIIARPREPSENGHTNFSTRSTCHTRVIHRKHIPSRCNLQQNRT